MGSVFCVKATSKILYIGSAESDFASTVEDFPAPCDCNPQVNQSLLSIVGEQGIGRFYWAKGASTPLTNLRLAVLFDSVHPSNSAGLVGHSMAVGDGLPTGINVERRFRCAQHHVTTRGQSCAHPAKNPLLGRDVEVDHHISQ